MFGKGGKEDSLQSRLQALNARRAGGAAPAAPEPRAPAPVATIGPKRNDMSLDEAKLFVEPAIAAAIDGATARAKSRAELARMVDEVVRATLEEKKVTLSALTQRDLITSLLNSIVDRAQREAPRREAPQHAAPAAPAQAAPRTGQVSASRASIELAIPKIYPLVMERIDPEVASKLQRPELARQLQSVVGEILIEQKIQLNQLEQRDLVTVLLDDMLGLGPIEPLLADETVSDILVNGPKQVYIERKGKLELTGVTFRDNGHVMAISTRKFSKKTITLDTMAKSGSISPEMAVVLKIASRARLNIVISGGTGSGKTTTLNALSQMIDEGERICTIEDAAELQLQQPHVVRLETRPPNLEGKGEITMRDLLENMVGMSGVNLPAKAVRQQIAAAVHMIVQVSRMRDGGRRIVAVTEVVVMEGEIITTQDLFTYQFEGEGADGKLKGKFVSTGLRPHFTPRAEYYGRDKALLEAIG